jgi:NTP pyrophosphatase (non-canonical NTP hydrolase)
MQVVQGTVYAHQNLPRPALLQAILQAGGIQSKNGIADRRQDSKAAGTAPREEGERRQTMTPIEQKAFLNQFAAICHEANKTWWIDPSTGEPKARNIGELLMLCVSELAEAMEGHRKNLADDKLPHRRMFEVEIADCMIRLFDLAAGTGIDLGGAFVDKMAYNATRADHKIENRMKPGGKAY